jgi:hypothetical protein
MMAWDNLQNKSKQNVVKEAMGNEPQEASEPSDLKSMEIEPADNAGFTVTHRMKDKSKGKEPATFTPPKKFVFGSHQEMMAHVHKHTAPKGKK